jgi:uncharacterized protein (TIGR02284 family)
MTHSDTLNKLIETSRDGEYGFRTSSENVRGADLRQLFTRRAEECDQAVRDLQSQVQQLGGAAEDSGTMAGAAHRGWVAVKGTLAGYTDLKVLEETERGEDVALESYRNALAQQGMGPEARALIERQLEGVKRNHAQVRMLRDQARATAS